MTAGERAPDPTPVAESALLHHYLTGRDVACPHCEYNLRDLTGTKCPECGEELILRVQPVEPRQAAALAGLIGLCCGGGMNAMLLLYALFEMGFGHGMGNWFNSFVGVNAGGLLVLGLCVALWLWAWRRIRRLDPLRRWMLAGSCYLLSIADVIVFFKIIR